MPKACGNTDVTANGNDPVGSDNRAVSPSPTSFLPNKVSKHSLSNPTNISVKKV